MRISIIVLIELLIIMTGSALIQVRTGPVMPQDELSNVFSDDTAIFQPNGLVGNQDDIVEISVSVQSTNGNGTMASAENRYAMDRIVKALIAMGINRSDISPNEFTGISTRQSSNVVCNKTGNDTICKTESSHENALTTTKIVRIGTRNPDFENRVFDIVEDLGGSATVLS